MKVPLFLQKINKESCECRDLLWLRADMIVDNTGNGSKQADHWKKRQKVESEDSNSGENGRCDSNGDKVANYHWFAFLKFFLKRGAHKCFSFLWIFSFFRIPIIYFTFA